MNEISCPHCNNAFKIDQAGYADIVKQVRDREFTNQLNERLESAERERKRPRLAQAEDSKRDPVSSRRKRKGPSQSSG